MFNKIIIQRKKISEYLLYFFVFLLPIQTRLVIDSGYIQNSYLEYLRISLYLSDIVLFFLFLFSFSFFKKIFLFKKNIFLFFLSFWEFFVFVSIFSAINKKISFYHYLVFLGGIFLFFVLSSDFYNKTKLYFSLGIGVFLQSLLAIWQFLSQETFSCKYFGIAKHNASDLGVSVVEVLEKNNIAERWLRSYGSMDHPNILGGFLTMSFFLLFFFYLFSFETKRKSFVALFFSFFVLTLTAIFFSFSKTSWLALLLGFFVLSLMVFINKTENEKKIIISIFSLFFLFFISVYPYTYLAFNRIKGQGRLEEKSNIERLSSISQARKIIKNNLFFGVGIGNYSLALIKEYPKKNFWFYQPVHNVFLLILAEIGLFGFLFFLSFLFLLFYFSAEKLILENLVISFILLVFFLFDHWLWSLHFGVFFLFFVLGILYKNIIKEYYN